MEEEICSLFENVCFTFSAVTAAVCVGAFNTGLVLTTVSAINTLPPAPGTEWSAWGHNRGSLGGWFGDGET